MIVHTISANIVLDVVGHRTFNHVASQQYQVERALECNLCVDTAATRLRARRSLYVNRVLVNNRVLMDPHFWIARKGHAIIHEVLVYACPLRILRHDTK